MPELTFERLPFLLALIVPGFVWARVHRYFQLRRPAREDSWLDILVLSAMNFALWSWVLPSLWIRTNEALAARTSLPLPVRIAWPVIALLSPALLGIASGLAHRRGWLRAFLTSKLGFAVELPFDTAWVFAFKDREPEFWATVTLKDGSIVEGRYGRDSLASTLSPDRDLFLEEVYRQDPSGRLGRVLNSAGVWIAGSEIRTVELRHVRLASKGKGVVGGTHQA
jgi:hypothetical protein